MTDRTHPPEDDAPDPVSQLRALPDRYREVLAPGAGNDRVGEPGSLPPDAVEEAAQARDVLASTARRVERLLEDSKPVGEPAEGAPPRRGHYNLDPEVVLEVLDTHAERLAELAEAVPDEAADRGAAVREGLQAITGEMVSEAVAESERRLREAKRTLDEGG